MHGLEIEVEDVRVDPPHQIGTTIEDRLAARDPIRRCALGDGYGNRRIFRRDYLRRIPAVDLVAVVARGVVAGCDNHRRPGAEVFGREGDDRCRSHIGEEGNGNARSGKDTCRIFGEYPRGLPGVEAHHDAPIGPPIVNQVTGQAGSGLDDRRPVHPTASGAHLPSNACSTE